MKTTCPTRKCLRWNRIAGLVAIFIFTSLSYDLHAQCPLACNDNVQVSVGDDCCAEITPDMILESPGLQCNYQVVVYDENDNPLPSNTVCEDQIGKTLKVRVTLGANSCWGNIHIEDKQAPMVDCAAPQFINCNITRYPISPDAVRDNCGPVETIIISDDWVDYPCDSLYSGARIICRAYEDQSGNRSDTCCHYIYFIRPQPEDIELPADTVFSCTDFPGADPSITGYPTFDGFPVDPVNGYCEVNITYKDDTIDVCPGSYKILRNWIVYFWCLPSNNGNPLTGIQVIKIVDEDGPDIYCPGPRFRDTISTDVWTCTGSLLLPEPILLRRGERILDRSKIHVYDTSECSNVTYTVRHQAPENPNQCRPSNDVSLSRPVTRLPNGRWTVDGLPLGCNWFYYTFMDECGNVTECVIDIYVQDLIPPSAICDQHTIASLSIDGIAKVYAESLDDGSWDNCAIDSMRVRRMDRGNPCGQNIGTWEKFVEFCCNDIGKARMVEFAVWDEAGNSNICMVEVVTQDKLPPVVSCPPDITISCQFEWEDDDVFGTIVNAKFNQPRNPIIIDDSLVQFSGPAIDGEYYDNCIATFIVEVNENVECGNGTITRTFIVTDQGGLQGRCTQTITVRDFDRFRVDRDDWPDDYYSDADCVNGTNIDTSVTGSPDIADRGCGDIFVGYDDQTFTIEPDACLKILRHWTVIDWCYYNPNAPRSRGIWTHTQVIKINNSVAPVFTSSCDFRTYDLWGADCTEDIRLTATAEDDCTDEDDLRWRWYLDYDNDGSIDDQGTGNDIVRNLTAGLYHIRWTVTDQCDNESECWYEFQVIDRKKPTPYCRDEVVTVLMQNVKTVAIWAVDFNLNSEDNCTDKEDLEYAFLVNGVFVNSLTFDCNDIGENTVRMYVIDEAGNFDYCEVTVEIQDPNNLCGNAPRANVGGHIETWFGNELQTASVDLIKTNTNNIRSANTDNSGDFEFKNVAMYSDYIVGPVKLDKPEDGVTTRDLILIQRHLLGVQTFNSPYEYIAADATNNNDVAASDIAELRRLVLGQIADFRFGQKSWRFVDQDQVFTNPHNPFPYQETKQYADLSNHQMETDFKAVKIGDLDGDARTRLDEIKTRGGDGRLVLETDNAQIQSGELIEVPMYMSNMTSLMGMQATIAFDADMLDFVSLKAGSMDICASCVNTEMSNDGLLTLSWYQIDEVELGEDAIFTLVFEGKNEGQLQSALEFTSDITAAEAFSDLDVSYDISLTFRNSLDEGLAFELYQNVPNPFSSSTSIGFNLPSAQDVILSMFDVTGKTIKVVSGHFEKGHHEFLINANDLSFEGVLYYQLSAGSYVATKKMLLVR